MGEMLVEIMRPISDVEFHKTGEFLGPFPSGAPAIFIDTVARLGYSAAILGGVGQDGFGLCLLERLKSDGVCCEYVKSFPNKSTAVAFVAYFNDGSRKFIYHIDNTPAVWVETPDVKKISNPRFFHIMGCSLMINEKFRSSILETAEIFAGKGAEVTFDPNIRTELLGGRNIYKVIGPIMRNCSILFPGIDELKMLTEENEIKIGIKKLFLENKSMKVIVLKRGKKGCSVYTRDNKFDIDSYSVREVDPTGAGDCFDAGFLCGQLEGKSLVESGRMAAAAGALNATEFGPMGGNIKPDSIKELIDSKYGE
jgi:sugar/nucleoside kinase (ribokinase family)